MRPCPSFTNFLQHYHLRIQEIWSTVIVDCLQSIREHLSCPCIYCSSHSDSKSRLHSKSGSYVCSNDLDHILSWNSHGHCWFSWEDTERGQTFTISTSWDEARWIKSRCQCIFGWRWQFMPLLTIGQHDNWIHLMWHQGGVIWCGMVWSAKDSGGLTQCGMMCHDMISSNDMLNKGSLMQSNPNSISISWHSIMWSKLCS